MDQQPNHSHRKHFEAPIDGAPEGRGPAFWLTILFVIIIGIVLIIISDVVTIGKIVTTIGGGFVALLLSIFTILAIAAKRTRNS